MADESKNELIDVYARALWALQRIDGAERDEIVATIERYAQAKEKSDE